MAVKYHINPTRGPLECSASTPEGCLYGSDAPHYNDFVAAQESWEQSLSDEYGTFNTASKPTINDSNTKLSPEHKDSSDYDSDVSHFQSDYNALKENFVNNFESMEFEDIQYFADTSPEHYKVLDSVIKERGLETSLIRKNLDRINPNTNGPDKCDQDTYQDLKRDFEAYRDRTAELVEVYCESKNYATLCSEEEPLSLGNSFRTDRIHPDNPQWREYNANRVDGSEVGVLALKDFGKKSTVIENALSNIVRDKSTSLENNPHSMNSLNNRNNNPKNLNTELRTGNIYRGEVWNKRVRDDYAQNNPNVTVISATGEYVNPDREWQRVGVDGIIVSKDTKQPEGLLDIKLTGNSKVWEKGIPVAYRAQALYNLNATSLKYTDVRVIIDDNNIVEHRIYADEEIIKGNGVNMETYINNRVNPWFEKIKSQREA